MGLGATAVACGFRTDRPWVDLSAGLARAGVARARREFSHDGTNFHTHAPWCVRSAPRVPFRKSTVPKGATSVPKRPRALLFVNGARARPHSTQATSRFRAENRQRRCLWPRTRLINSGRGSRSRALGHESTPPNRHMGIFTSRSRIEQHLAHVA